MPGTGGGGGSPGPEMESEEAETEQWVSTLRVGAAVRGESLMAACSQSFAEERAARLDAQAQLEARASRTADVSEMEGPDGLLHCAVLRGEHALAARAAQFLVDKRGSNVNSRDEWGRCVRRYNDVARVSLVFFFQVCRVSSSEVMCSGVRTAGLQPQPSFLSVC